jgi:hypothetical protein
VKLFADPAVPLGDPNRLLTRTADHKDPTVEVWRFDYTDFYEQGPEQASRYWISLARTKDTLLGEGIIKIVEEETNERDASFSSRCE